jgi:putative transposase
MKFLTVISKTNKEQKFSIYAYCLMNNHVHLLINEGNEEIARIMKRINVSYAYYFNKKYKRVGHLFQDRFKSEAIESEEYLLAAARYIHNNPVKANIVSNPGLYRWSSYNTYVKEDKRLGSIVDTNPILGLFSHNNIEIAVKSLIEFTNQESSDEFIEYPEAKKDTELSGEDDTKVFITKYLSSKGQTLDELKEKHNMASRNDFIKLLKEKSNLSVRQLANILIMDRNAIQRVK